MMCRGALGRSVAVERMSAFKWRRMAEIAVREGVADVMLRAVERVGTGVVGAMDCNLSPSAMSFLRDGASKSKGQPIFPKMSNPALEKKMKKIFASSGVEGEKETLCLLQILIASCEHLFVKGPSTRLTVRLGNYIRTCGSGIDYGKTDEWLRSLQLDRAASLVGSVLVGNFFFSMDEVPFVKKADYKAARMMTASLARGGGNVSSGAFSFFEYAPVENASIVVRSLKTKLEEIEE